MKSSLYHLKIGERHKRYPFACRDDSTGALKPTPRNGSRKKFCRHCPALRIHHKCIFGSAKTRELLLRYQIVEPAHVAYITGTCTRCKKYSALSDSTFCLACRTSLETIERNTERAQCAFAGGCEQMIVVRANRSGMCQKHAQLARRKSETRRVNRAFTVGHD